ncbi:ABC transporter permease [Streptomyces sp. NPDC088789]|uniref:ABC transporter permease n=1 Tax=Streptomyces sp. NPDC088789 TaxID=3365899 RepID=UPI00382B8417
MNFVKRAVYSLVARKGRTAILCGIFTVVCGLLLGGSLLQGATARQEAEAQRRIGVDVTVRGERLTVERAARLGSSPLVERYNPVLSTVTGAPGLRLVESGRPPSAGERRRAEAAAGGAGPGVLGVRETELLLDFATGRARVTAGRAITAADRDRAVVMVEARLAGKNGLGVGDHVTLTAPDGGAREAFEVVGVFEDPLRLPDAWLPPAELAANRLYVPVGALRGLGAGERLGEAVYRISSPERARALHARAERLLGAGDGFRFDVNDKAYREQVGPLRRVGAFARAVVWLIAVAGAVILGLIVTLTIRERRGELGMLLALGEKRWKLIGQHTVEVTAVAVPALAGAAVAAVLLGDRLGDVLPAREPADRPRASPADRADRADGTDRADRADRADPLPRPEVRLTPGDLGRVAGTGLGIALAATVVPGVGILRLHPRSILTDTD